MLSWALGQMQTFTLGPQPMTQYMGSPWLSGCPFPSYQVHVPYLGPGQGSQARLFPFLQLSLQLTRYLVRLAPTELWPLVTCQTPGKLTGRGKDGPALPRPCLRLHSPTHITSFLCLSTGFQEGQRMTAMAGLGREVEASWGSRERDVVGQCRIHPREADGGGTVP